MGEEEMTFEQLEQSLPNGFHDAKLRAINIDYVTRASRLDLDLLVGDPEGGDQQSRNILRPAVVTVSGFDFCVIDAPDPAYPYATFPLTIDAISGQPEGSEISLPPVTQGAFLFTIWINEWNAFIRIAALDLGMEWGE
jgi:hypothetical protein